jgi:ribosomal-protein-serine acetyltransferase
MNNNKANSHTQTRLTVNLQIELIQINKANAEEYFNLIEKNREFFTDKSSIVDIIHTLKDVEKFLSYFTNKFIRFGIYFEGKFVGVISIQNINEQLKSCSLGYFLDEEYTGKGIMTQSLSKVIEYCFDIHGLESLTLETKDDNEKSKNVGLRLGFKFSEEYKTDRNGWIYYRYILNKEGHNNNKI